MDIRSIQLTGPVKEHNDTTTVWWLVRPREMYEASVGGHLELICEWEVAAGGEVFPHTHPTHEYYYITAGRGIIVCDGEEREVGPGDLVYIPPDKVHSARPLTGNAPLRAVSFAVGLPGAGEIDYTTHEA
jgi:mannose-6-phosphate isomerase-like protein (cupin superfamily)